MQIFDDRRSVATDIGDGVYIQHIYYQSYKKLFSFIVVRQIMVIDNPTVYYLPLYPF